MTKKMTKEINLKNIPTEKLIEELWSRNGNNFVISQTYDLQDLKSRLQNEENYKNGDEKEFAKYLADSYFYQYSDEGLEEMATDFYEDKN